MSGLRRGGNHGHVGVVDGSFDEGAAMRAPSDFSWQAAETPHVKVALSDA